MPINSESDSREKALGPEHPDSAMSLSSLARFYRVMPIRGRRFPFPTVASDPRSGPWPGAPRRGLESQTLPATWDGPVGGSRTDGSSRNL